MTPDTNTNTGEQLQRYITLGGPGDMDPHEEGDYVKHSDALAAIARAREEARREALEEAVDQVKCLISCVNAGPRNDGEEWHVVDTLEDAMSAIRALLTPTPQGETKEASRGE